MKGILVHILTLSAVFISSDAQGCRSDWVHFENSCYLFIDEYVPWTSAKVFCDAQDAKMLEVETAEENDFIASEIRKLSGIQAAWMGLTDLVVDGRWQWNSNREVPEYFNWAHGQPDNSHQHENGEDCVEIQPDGSWNDLWCENFQDDARYTPSPVCEIELSSETLIG